MRLAHASIVLALALAPFGCGGGSEEAAPAAPTPSSAPEAATPAPAPAPAPATTPVPVPATTPAPQPVSAAGGSGDAGAGAPLYATYCVSCHGPRGDGDGPASAGLNPKPARHSDAAYMNPLSDEHLFTVIKGGGPAVGKSPLMPSWGGALSDAQIRDLVAFVRTLAH